MKFALLAVDSRLVTLLCGVVSYHQQSPQQPFTKTEDTALFARIPRIILNSKKPLLQKLLGA